MLFFLLLVGIVFTMSHEEEGHLPLFKSPLLYGDEGHSSISSQDEGAIKHAHHQVSTNDDQTLHDNPQYHRHAEATTAELFYDLFFVANLTVFTNVHEVNDGETLKQYIGFFCVLWFTWYQVSLYDVRFSTDSVFERSAKAIQFLVMIGFAITGPKFDVGKAKKDEDSKGPSLVYFKALTLVLMVSRLVLVFQYLQSLWFTRHYKKTILPMLMVASTYFVAAIIYLGLFWSFHLNGTGKNHSYIAWYIVAICETIVATAVSSVYRNISFKGTHLVQRMSLLTLIILGEGVIVVAKTCQKIVKAEGVLKFSGSTIGSIISAILILYFIYMLYFDWMEEEHFGTIWQQIWSFLHFPLHLALVLAVEGVAQSISWRAAITRFNAFDTQFVTWYNALNTTNVPASTYASISSELYNTTFDITYAALTNSASLGGTLDLIYDLPNIQNATAVIASGTSDPELALLAMEWTYYNSVKTILNVAGFSPPENFTAQTVKAENAAVQIGVDFAEFEAFEDSTNVLNRTIRVFGETFVRVSPPSTFVVSLMLGQIYFLVAIGLFLVICTLIAALSKREKRRFHWVRLGATAVIGVMLCLMSIMATTAYGTNFIISVWVLPTVMIVLFVAVVLNSIKPAFPDLKKMSRMGSRH
ncbi:hypothetical protein CLAFUW4_06423 [Fulvia fulva]|nr:hypothetical protein CLAFUR4_06426 [Fulvia fulva]WPV14953.1 hypothetical protein CLAFUW4_06423 [Fulvia fulva]